MVLPGLRHGGPKAGLERSENIDLVHATLRCPLERLRSFVEDAREQSR
jgi:hypothetical protein